MQPRVAIDPEGDMVLQIGQDQPSKLATDKVVVRGLEIQELTVSTKVLSLASPVFKAIICGNFKEGIEFAEKKALSETYLLPLPEDDAETVILLCRILHFNTKEIPEKPTPVCLEKLAFLCDKYQCAGAMKYCGGVWLRDWMLSYDDEKPPIEDLCRLLVFAYVIDLPYEFLNVSWKLFLHHKGQFLGASAQATMLVDHPLLGQDVARELDFQRFKCCQLLHEGIMAPMNWNWATLSKPCFRAAKALGTYVEALSNAKVIPYDIEFSQHIFGDLIKRISFLPYITTSDISCPVNRCGCTTESKHNLSFKLQSEVGLIKKKERTFICLDCLKTNGSSKNEGICRISHD